MKKQAVKVCTYRYIWQDDVSMRCKYLTDTEEAHKAFMTILEEDDKVVAAFREYVNEIDYGKVAQTETFKERKEVASNEEV